MSGPPYIVWSPEGPTPPKISHPTHKAAHREACRLAKLYPGQQFYVMGRCGKGAKVAADFCTKHPDQLAVANLDGEFQCQLCADAWACAEGQAAAEAEDETCTMCGDEPATDALGLGDNCMAELNSQFGVGA